MKVSDKDPAAEFEATQPVRCSWCRGDALYEQYHDEEWGLPVFDAQALFERLVLEGMQAGLSWLTVLKKRERMQQQFFGFEVERLAAAGPPDLERWLQDPGIIRHRGKLQAMIGNAQLTLAAEDFSGMLWQFAPPPRSGRNRDKIPSETEQSRAMSKTLKKQGFRFVGPTICYAFMQSVGMVNDHSPDCWRHAACAEQVQQAVAISGPGSGSVG